MTEITERTAIGKGQPQILNSQVYENDLMN